MVLTVPRPDRLESRGLGIAAGTDVAFCHGLSGVTGTRAGGGTIQTWYRTTICSRKVGGAWMITHAHHSVPFDVESGSASLALRPDQQDGEPPSDR